MRNGRAVDVVRRPLSAAGKNYQFQEDCGVEWRRNRDRYNAPEGITNTRSDARPYVAIVRVDTAESLRNALLTRVLCAFRAESHNAILERK